VTNQYPPLPIDINGESFLRTYDELSLWSAPFGLALLERLVYRVNAMILDVGSGFGFPLLEIAQRFGPTCKAIGVDPWENGIRKAREKAAAIGLPHVSFVQCGAEDMPFPDAYFDLVVSNNGLNNVADERKVLQECARAARQGAQLVCTMNLPESMQTFNAVMKLTLRQAGLEAQQERLKEHIVARRKPLDYWRRLLLEAGWLIVHEDTSHFTMRFLDGTTLFQHAFIRAAFLDGWLGIVPEHAREDVFRRLEENLNKRAAREGSLPMEVPFVCFDCRKG
jgi:ubiquinone/menaquinone biosynthesis C-methylase UbiE